MNITGLMNNSVNVSMNMLLNKRYCEVLQVSLNYNLYITINFIYFLMMFLEMKRGILTSIGKEIDIDIKRIGFLSMLIFNVCMLLFQFILLPLTSLAGG